MTQTTDRDTGKSGQERPLYEGHRELNHYGLATYHVPVELCWPSTSIPAFKFWQPFTETDLPDYVSPMRAWQDGRCGMCGFREQLVEDHCHETGLVRGLLCRSCNTLEGMSGRNFEQWRAGVNVAAEMGVEIVYVGIYG